MQRTEGVVAPHRRLERTHHHPIWRPVQLPRPEESVGAHGRAFSRRPAGAGIDGQNDHGSILLGTGGHLPDQQRLVVGVQAVAFHVVAVEFRHTVVAIDGQPDGTPFVGYAAALHLHDHQVSVAVRIPILAARAVDGQNARGQIGFVARGAGLGPAQEDHERPRFENLVDRGEAEAGRGALRRAGEQRFLVVLGVVHHLVQTDRRQAAARTRLVDACEQPPLHVLQGICEARLGDIVVARIRRAQIAARWHGGVHAQIAQVGLLRTLFGAPHEEDRGGRDHQESRAHQDRRDGHDVGPAPLGRHLLPAGRMNVFG